MVKGLPLAIGSSVLGFYLVRKLYAPKPTETSAADPKQPTAQIPSSKSPAKASPAVSTSPKVETAFDPNYPDTGVYKSRPEDCVLSSNLLKIGAKLYTAGPVRDNRSKLFARLDYNDSRAFLASKGLRLITAAEWVALLTNYRDQCMILRPCTMGDWESNSNKMRSLGYQKKHDECVSGEIASHGGWDASTILINCGKQWLDGAPKGKSINYGWFWNQNKNEFSMTPIQGPGQAHEDTYTDYSQLTMGVRDVSDSDSWSDLAK